MGFDSVAVRGPQRATGWLLPIGLAVTLAIGTLLGCQRRDASGDRSSPSAARRAAASTQPSPSGSGSETTTPKLRWQQALAGLRQALAKRNVELALDASKVFETTGCDGKTRTIQRMGRSFASKFPCHICEPVREDEPLLPTHEAGSRFLQGIASAVARYPAAVLRRAEVKTVRLCGKIKTRRDGSGAGGTVDYYNGTILLLTASSKYSAEERSVFGDKEWVALNAPSFRYGEQPKGAPLPPGMLNHYAATDEDEDRAVVYQFMMGSPAELCRWAARDPRIAAKARMLHRRLSGAFADDIGFLDRRVSCLGATGADAG